MRGSLISLPLGFNEMLGVSIMCSCGICLYEACGSVSKHLKNKTPFLGTQSFYSTIPLVKNSHFLDMALFKFI